MQKPLILVVGGAGFIGSQVNKKLHQEGYETLVLDNLSTGHSQAVVRGRLVKGELSDIPFLEQLFSENPIDAVMHFAASIDVLESVQDPLKYYQNNVSCTINLLEVMRKHGLKPLVFSSSAAVYGHPHTPLITEEHPCSPINPYGQTKRIIEHILSDMDQAYGLRFATLRYFNAAGGDPEGEIKNWKSKEHNLIPKLLRNIKQGHPQITLYGEDYPTKDGTCIRDYIHIEDLAQAHVLVLNRLLRGAPSCCYNLGNGCGYSVREVVKATEEVVGCKIHSQIAPRRPGDPAVLMADPSKAMKELSWKPSFTDLESMIQHAWQALQF